MMKEFYQTFQYKWDFGDKLPGCRTGFEDGPLSPVEEGVDANHFASGDVFLYNGFMPWIDRHDGFL